MVEPLTSTESRMHVTVSPSFMTLLKKARAGQSHVQPGASDEQVLTAALELLIEKQGKGGLSAATIRSRPRPPPG